MSKINKIVKFSLLADQIAKSPEVIELDNDDLIVIHFPSGTTYEDASLFQETLNDITQTERKVVMLLDPIDIFGAKIEDLEEMMKSVKEMKESE